MQRPSFTLDRLARPAFRLGVAAATFLLSLATVVAQIPSPTLWFRADTLITKTDSGYVTGWGNLGSKGGTAAAADAARPVYKGSALGGKPALSFNGSTTFMTGPSEFPINADYTVYAVVKNTTIAGANNIVGGTSHTVWLNNSWAPRVLHNGDFSHQVTSGVDMPGGTAIVRVRYVQSTKTVTIHVNNQKGEEGPIPANPDPTFYIGAYAGGNVFAGDISEILVFNTALSDNDINAVDGYLHTRYSIGRTPPPEAPIVRMNNPPRMSQIYPLQAKKVDLSGTTLVDGIDSIKIKRNYFGVTYYFGGPLTPNKGTTFKYEFVADTIQQDFLVQVRLNGVWKTVVDAQSVMAGIPIIVTGQSNSIMGGNLDGVGVGRTFGSNYSNSRSDTTFKMAECKGNGGGPNIGAWAMEMVRQLALNNRYPTLTINGGVGGTTIEQNSPDPDDHMNVNTIYGSWLYRVEKSGVRPYVEHLFWYQGESNNGEGYGDKFDRLYQAWHEDLPALKHIYVIQIHTGCGGDGHALLRDTQRRFKDKYPDVEVHSVSGLPGHDGCHFALDGYQALGTQMYRLLLRNQIAKVYEDDVESPNVQSINYTNAEKTDVVITFRNVKKGISLTPSFDYAGHLRTPAEAFYVNDTAGKVTNVTVDGNSVILTLANPGTARYITYVPDRYYADTAVIYEGPWMQNALGIGAMTFRVTVDGITGVDEDPAAAPPSTTITLVRPGEHHAALVDDAWFALDGTRVSGQSPTVPSIPNGVYVVGRRLVAVTN